MAIESKLKKTESFLFYLILFLIPSNLAKHWPQDWSLVNGILVDYYIPTLYLTDILILILFSTYLIKTFINKYNKNLKKENKDSNIDINKNNYFNQGKTSKKNIFYYTLLLIFSFFFLLSFQALNQQVAIYKLIKILLFVLFTIYIKTYINIKKDINNISKVLCFSIIWQSLLAVCQWFKQASIFGYWFFGEQPYNPSTLGIKKINFFGALKVPSHGTFSHPNVLAGFLTTSLIIILIKEKKQTTLLQLLAVSLGIVALFLSFSFFSWSVLLLILISFFAKKKKFNKLFLLILIIYLLFKNTVDLTSIIRRLRLMEISYNMFLTNPIFGIGLNNFIARMEEYGHVIANIRFLQPVHNIYLLILTETGLVGFFIMLYGLHLILKQKKRLKKYNLSSLYSLLLLGLFDHYLLTIQQGMLLTSIVIGLACASTATASSTASSTSRKTS